MNYLIKAYALCLFCGVGLVHSAEIKELDAIDLSRPIPSGTCVADSSRGKGFDKIEALKMARGQTNVVEANDVHMKKPGGSAYGGIYFTSNLRPAETKGFLGEGYVITSETPKGKIGSLYCVEIANDMTGLASVIHGKKVPINVNKGDMGRGLNNSMIRADSKVGYVAITSQKTLLAVNFNFKTKKGGYMLADGAGNNLLPLPLVDVEYSLDLPQAYQRALGLPTEK